MDLAGGSGQRMATASWEAAAELAKSRIRSDKFL